ncbi:MAG TPA: response regulator transcription factor [Pyrinomonadaceae bacterium]|nr:response regulator transcription factor [Pyrinomonadaceae bacterium]
MAKRLLVVDDEAKLLRAVAVTLREEGYEVTTARSGAEALVAVNANVPHLIISDIRMPGMDGYQLARALRANPRTELIPVIFLTAKGERKDRLAGIRAGVDAYLTKPFDPEELLAVASNILSRVERTGAELSRLVGTAKGEESSASQSAPDEDFTESESRIARLVADGLSNKEIAAELGVSVRTVEGHISNILSKKGWSNRVEIARHVFKGGAPG